MSRVCRILALSVVGCVPRPWIAADTCTERDGTRTSRRSYDISFDEKLLATIPEGMELPESLRSPFSPDGRVAAFVGTDGRRSYFCSPIGTIPYVFVDGPYFSADGKSLAYVGCGDSKNWYVELGGKSAGPFDWVNMGGFVGKSLFYIGVRGDCAFIHLGDYQSPPLKGLRHETVGTTDGNKPIFVQSRNGKEFVVHADATSEGFDRIGQIAWSRGGKTIAFSAREGAGAFIVVNGKRGELFEDVSIPTLSSDGQSLAFCAKKDGKAYIVLGTERLGPYDEVLSLRFGPNGRTLGSQVRKNGRALTIVGGVEGPGFDRVGELTFSPDGSTVAYTAVSGASYFVVIGSKRSEPFDEVKAGSLVFSPNGKAVAYMARKGEHEFVVVDDRRSRAFRQVKHPYCDYHLHTGPVFSPDSNSVAFGALQGDRWHLVVGEEMGPGFDDVGDPHFSLDGRKVAFGARLGRELWWKVRQVK